MSRNPGRGCLVSRTHARVVQASSRSSNFDLPGFGTG